MKINIKITKDQLDAMNYALQHERDIIVRKTVADKVYFYLYEEVIKKLLKKEIDKYHDFSNKKFKMSFSYPEAAALCNELNTVNSSQTYRENVCNLIRYQLHQKLY